MTQEKRIDKLCGVTVSIDIGFQKIPKDNNLFEVFIDDVSLIKVPMTDFDEFCIIGGCGNPFGVLCFFCSKFNRIDLSNIMNEWVFGIGKEDLKPE